MRRREFITLLGGAAAAWPITARAQQPATPVIGFLSSRSPGESTDVVAAFHEGLREKGLCRGTSISTPPEFLPSARRRNHALRLIAVFRGRSPHS
jgi:putative tryptophan/tyrosine transport system substrate-binding protein